MPPKGALAPLSGAVTATSGRNADAGVTGNGDGTRPSTPTTELDASTSPSAASRVSDFLFGASARSSFASFGSAPPSTATGAVRRRTGSIVGGRSVVNPKTVLRPFLPIAFLPLQMARKLGCLSKSELPRIITMSGGVAGSSASQWTCTILSLLTAAFSPCCIGTEARKSGRSIGKAGAGLR